MSTKKFFRITITTIIMTISMQLFSVSAYALTSGGACAIDADTGEVLFEYNADTPLVPASMTKFMTVYITFDKIREGLLTKDTLITCSQEAAKISRDPGASNIPMIAGEQYSVDELIGAALVPSSCSAAYLLGEHIAGSNEEFVKLMNEYVYKLGLEAYYADCMGLSHQNRITPRSMATLGVRFVNDFPEVLEYTSAKFITFRGVRYGNTNALLPGRSYAYPGADGLKTGTSSSAGCCITATAEQDGTRVVAVTMRSLSVPDRYKDIRSILDSAFKKEKSLRTHIRPDTTRIFIDGAEIPSMYADDESRNTVILAEHLSGYGFDVEYNAEERAVYITRNPEKAPVPVDCAQFENFTASVRKNSDLRVIIADGENNLEISMVYDLSGYAAIPLTDLERIYSYTWSTPEMSGYFISKKEV